MHLDGRAHRWDGGRVAWLLNVHEEARCPVLWDCIDAHFQLSQWRSCARTYLGFLLWLILQVMSPFSLDRLWRFRLGIIQGAQSCRFRCITLGVLKTLCGAIVDGSWLRNFESSLALSACALLYQHY